MHCLVETIGHVVGVCFSRVGLQMSFCPDRAFLLIFLSGHMTM